MKLFNHLVRAWNKWLARVAKANREEFGVGSPTCCGHGTRPRPKR